MAATIGQKITPFLWFNGQAEEAANFYVSVFKNSRILGIARVPAGGNVPAPEGSVLTVDFELDGQRFTAMNGGAGTHVVFNEGVSMVVHCATQAEIDLYWEKLASGGGEEVCCGWLKDRYGLRWQIWPAGIDVWLRDPAKCQRVMAKVVHMMKLDMAELERAAAG